MSDERPDYNLMPLGLLSLIVLPPITWRDRLLWRIEEWTPFLVRWAIFSALVYAWMTR